MKHLISRSVAPMHLRPDACTEQVSQALLGMPVEVQAQDGNWSRVRTPDGYEGWVEVGSYTQPPAAWEGPWGEIEELWANLRPEADYRLAAHVHAPIGVRLHLVERDEKWTGLRLPDGRTLWTESHRVRVVDRDPLRPASPRALARTARRFLGVPYLWGGCSPLGIDCSGFVQLVMRLHGIELLRDAYLQGEQGNPVERPGAADLVFFGPADGADRITHVGMMLDERRFIHAKGSECVRIDVLETHRAHTFRFARRVLPRG